MVWRAVAHPAGFRRRAGDPAGGALSGSLPVEHQGALAGEWGESQNNRRAKFYQLASALRDRLGEESEKWKRMAGDHRDHAARHAGGRMNKAWNRGQGTGKREQATALLQTGNGSTAS